MRLKRQRKTIAIVPTMGALHEGHRTLVRRARKKVDILILTIFVNPTQFGPKEDFKKYPRHTKADLAKARQDKVDIVFMPRVDSLYPSGYETYVEVTKASQSLCGASRPGHFRGVTTIVLKLFNLIVPDVALFGLKDYQQFAVLRRMVQDLNLPIKIIGVPTVREPDGLAMSSRNAYLSERQRKAARCLSRGLFKIKQEAQKKRDLKTLLRILRKEIQSEPLARIDYLKVMDAQTIQPAKKYKKGKTLFAVAAFVGKTRLIDNVVV